MLKAVLDSNVLLLSAALWLGFAAVITRVSSHGGHALPGREISLAASPDTQHLGRCVAGSQLECAFTVRNTGTVAVTAFATAPCGCTVLDRQPRQLSPGESFRLPVAFDTDGMHGDVQRAVHVNFYVDGEPLIRRLLELTIQATVESTTNAREPRRD